MPEFDEDTLAMLTGAVLAQLKFVSRTPLDKQDNRVVLLVGAAGLLCSYLVEGEILPEYRELYEETKRITKA